MRGALKMEALCGDEIKSTIFRAIELAKRQKRFVEFEFNGVTVRVDALSNAELIYRDWHRGINGYLGENPIVGPRPTPELTTEEIASDAAIEAQNELKRKQQHEKWKADAQTKVVTLQHLLAEAPAMSIKDSGSWQIFVDANKDGYGARVVRYAEEWARLMQMRLAEGCPISESADETSHIADDDGITGFMHSCAKRRAASMLVRCWAHGDELKAWKQG